jgi:CBS domain-containing protein/Trk K+ transport system NAD-binding subunit
VRAKKDTNLMRGILVQEAMTPIAQITTVTPDLGLPELARLFQETGHHGFLVLDQRGELYGVVTLADLERSLTSGGTAATVADICTTDVLTTDVLTAFSDETLDDALRHFGALDVGRIPVVDRQHPRQAVGVLRRGDIVHAYSHALVDKHQREHIMERLRLESQIGVKLVQVDVSPGDTAAGKHLKEISLPADCVVVSIYRGGRVVVPRGDTQLLSGDRVTALVGATAVDSLKETLQTGNMAQRGGGSSEASGERIVDVLDELLVREVMETDTAILRELDELAVAAGIFAQTRHHGLPVVDAAGDLVGILTVQDLERVRAEGAGAAPIVGQACTRDLLVTYPDETIGVALQRMSARDVGRLPVVARDNPRRLLGILRRADMVRAYDIALTRRATLRHRAQTGRLDVSTGAEVSVQEITVQTGAPCVGQRIGQAGWPRDSVIASVRREQRTLVPHGDTMLQAGDVLVVVAEGEAAEEARRLCNPGR